MSVALVPLCQTGKAADRDGGVGNSARLLAPNYIYGYWFADGKQYTFPSGRIGQDQSITTSGSRQANTFIKAYGVCLQP